MEKPGERRRSFFEKVDLTTQEKEKTDTLLEEWDKIWGKYNLDYVNVVKYPDRYVEKIKNEREMWLKGLDHISEKAEKLTEEDKFDLVINEDILAPDQKASLRGIDSRINEYIKKSSNFLKEFEVYKRKQEVMLAKIEKEIKIVEKMATAKNSLKKH